MTQLLNCLPPIRSLFLALGDGVVVLDVLEWLKQQTQLEQLTIYHNSNSGPLGLFESLPRLKGLEFRGCSEMVELPPDVCSCSNLEWLALVGCQKLASLPIVIGSMSQLRYLRIANCRSLSKVPKSMADLCLDGLEVSDCGPDLFASLPLNLQLLAEQE
jgi:hypothetical protein